MNDALFGKLYRDTMQDMRAIFGTADSSIHGDYRIGIGKKLRKAKKAKRKQQKQGRRANR